MQGPENAPQRVEVDIINGASEQACTCQYVKILSPGALGLLAPSLRKQNKNSLRLTCQANVQQEVLISQGFAQRPWPLWLKSGLCLR